MEPTSNERPTTPDSSFSEPPPERSTSLWFDDGNVVLQTTTKQYRVHRSVLSSHSSVFRDMFSVPQPESQDTVAGCPVVDVTDSAQDWDILLAVMYGDQHMVDPKRGVIPVEILRAAIILGTKYDFGRYRTTAVDQLDRLFPTTLEDWDESSGLREEDCYDGRWIELLEIVRSFGYRRMIPSAFYLSVAQVSLPDILNEYRQKRDRPMPLNSLNQLFYGQLGMEDALRNRIFKWCWDGSIPAKDCLESANCSQLLFPFFRRKTPQPNMTDPLRSSYEEIKLCSACKKVAAEEHSKGRQSTWWPLPEFFGLEDWDDLCE